MAESQVIGDDGSTSLISACGVPALNLGVEPRRSVSAFELAGVGGRNQ